MLYSGADPESYIIEYTSVYEEDTATGMRDKCVDCVPASIAFSWYNPFSPDTNHKPGEKII